MASSKITGPRVEAVNILGVKVSAIDMSMAIEMIDHWIKNRESNYVCVRDVHGVIACQDDDSFRRIHAEAGMVTPDGMPLVWMSHLLGYRKVDRVSGADLMAAACEQSVAKGHSHYLLGGMPGIADQLSTKLAERYPGIRIAGTHCPPYRDPSDAEDRRIVETINQAEADIVWVGLGSPKQERWMAEHVGRIDAPVMLGVGAAFDFLNGTIDRAPYWMQRSGLEWLYRLIKEPRRLWRRYILTTPRFIPLALMQITGARKFPADLKR